MPPQIQRMQAEDLLAAAFPDAAACLENIPGDREIPNHPLVRQTIDDCVHELMDLDRLTQVLRRIQAGEIQLVARDLPEPSPLAHEILNAKPYAFLDDAPLEERRTQAVYTRRAFEPSSADDLGALDPAAIQRVRDEAWPEIQNADELHDALLTSGFLTEVEGISGREGKSWGGYFRELVEAGRADRVELEMGQAIWVAVERIPEVRALGSGPDAGREDAIRELVRGRLGIVGPTTAAQLAGSLNVSETDADVALAALEVEGVVLRGRFTAEGPALEWCDRRLLARIHRYTLNRLRAEIEPVSGADFMRFLFAWQRVDPEQRAGGLEGLASVIGQLDGFEVPAGAWESEVLSARCEEYDPMLLDTLSLTGRVAWGRVTERGNEGTRDRAAGPIRSTPIALFLREHAADWLADRNGGEYQLSSYAARVREVLQQRGASFFHELVPMSGLLPTQVEQALGELAGLGVVTSDSFAGLRALTTPSSKRKPLSTARRRHRTAPYGIESAGRWSLLASGAGEGDPEAGSVSSRSTWDSRSRERTAAAGGPPSPAKRSIELNAHVLLRRYGVVFKRLLARESGAPAWRELLLVYRRLEARGELRGGRFVAGMSGEQFALPEAVGQLRSIRRLQGGAQLIGISAADPLNLTGIVTPGERIPGLTSNRILYRDGVPILAREAGAVKSLIPDLESSAELIHALVRKTSTPALRSYLGMTGAPAASVPLNRRPGARHSRQKENVNSER
jgi:ATP-dependent Lhr-like helicase